MTQQFHPAAFCVDHGIFEATAFSASGNATFIGCVTDCPRCGRRCEVISGVYDVTQTGLNVLLDKSISVGAIAGLKRLAEELQAKRISLPQAQAEAEKISPLAKKLFDISDWPPASKATLYAAIITAAGAMTTAAIATRVGSSHRPEIIETDKRPWQPTTSLFNAPLPKPKPKGRR